MEYAKKYYLAARGYFQESADRKSFGYNQSVDQNRYELKIFPLEHAFPSKNISLMDLPLNKFRNTINDIVDEAIQNGYWAIFVFHGTKESSLKYMIDNFLRQPLYAIKSIHNIPKMLKRSQIDDNLAKFRCFCELLISNDKVKVMTILEVIENLDRIFQRASKSV